MQDRAQQLFEPLARAKSAGDPSRAFPKLSLALVAAGPQDRIEGEVRRAAAPATPAHVVRMRLAEASTGIDRFPNKITNLAGVADSRPPRCSTNVSTRRRVQQRRWPRFPYAARLWQTLRGRWRCPTTSSPPSRRSPPVC